LEFSCGFFDGASQDKVLKCGAGYLLKCPLLGSYILKMHFGRGTNTRGELLALWCLLFFARNKKITRLYLVGDLNIVIDWFANDGNLQVISLQSWMEKIRLMSGSFLQLEDKHICREYNQGVDQLSKDALRLEEYGIFCANVTEGQTNFFERLGVNH
jgi:ribonuclease HI